MRANGITHPGRVGSTPIQGESVRLYALRWHSCGRIAPFLLRRSRQMEFMPAERSLKQLKKDNTKQTFLKEWGALAAVLAARRYWLLLGQGVKTWNDTGRWPPTELRWKTLMCRNCCGGWVFPRLMIFWNTAISLCESFKRRMAFPVMKVVDKRGKYDRIPEETL